MGQRPPFETFTKPTCRGSFELGTACGRCEACEWHRAQRAAYSLEASLPKAPIAPNDNTMTISFSELVERSGLDEDTLLERLAEIFTKRDPPVTELVIDPLSSHTGGMTTAERELLLATAGWVAGLLQFHGTVASINENTSASMLGRDAATILTLQAGLVRKESERGG